MLTVDKTTAVAMTVHGCYNSRQNRLWFCQYMVATTAMVVVAMTIHGCYGQDNSCCSQDSAYGHYNQDNASGRGNAWLLWPRQQLLKPRQCMVATAKTTLVAVTMCGFCGQQLL